MVPELMACLHHSMLHTEPPKQVTHRPYDTGTLHALTGTYRLLQALTKLCNQVYPWESVSEIQLIKESRQHTTTPLCGL